MCTCTFLKSSHWHRTNRATYIGSGSTKLAVSFAWHGIGRGSALSPSAATGKISIAGTTCTTNGTCSALRFELGSDWMKLFTLKNAAADLSTMKRQQYEKLWHSSI